MKWWTNNWRCRKMYTKKNDNNTLFSSMFCCWFIWNAHASSKNAHTCDSMYLYVSTSIQLKLPLIRLNFFQLICFGQYTVHRCICLAWNVLIAIVTHKNDSMSSLNNIFRFVVETNCFWCHTKIPSNKSNYTLFLFV